MLLTIALLTTVLLFWELKKIDSTNIAKNGKHQPGKIYFVVSLSDLTDHPAAEDATHDGGEGNFELLVGHDVDDWIECWVKIACKSLV